MRVPAPVPQLSVTPGSVRWLGRDQGQDNRHVFVDLLGLSPDTVANMRQRGLI
jgi:hypothetical protein